jgi:hypothetical protein
MGIFERWCFGLCWNLRLVIESVMISWRILGFFYIGFFLKIIIFAWWNIWIFIILLFWLPMIVFNVNGKAHGVVTHPLFLWRRNVIFLLTWVILMLHVFHALVIVKNEQTKILCTGPVKEREFGTSQTCSKGLHIWYIRSQMGTEPWRCGCTSIQCFWESHKAFLLHDLW